LERSRAVLVITRRKNESIIIGDCIEVKVVDIKSNRVRIGIKAPPNYAIHREEILRLIKYEANKLKEEKAEGNRKK
jgi:carbon storage regulator